MSRKEEERRKEEEGGARLEGGKEDGEREKGYRAPFLPASSSTIFPSLPGREVETVLGGAEGDSTEEMEGEVGEEGKTGLNAEDPADCSNVGFIDPPSPLLS